MSTRAAVLAPGYGGSASQPILVALARELAMIDIDPRPITFTSRRPSRGYETELADLRAARDALRDGGAMHVALVGRSFGGRMCAFLAAREPPDALVILGHPIAPPRRPRPEDEAALTGITCPTLIVQGDRDELGPLGVLERIAGANPRIDLVVLPATGHDFGPREREAIAHAARWLDATLR
jgi:predicted alpha/beta-hydrolase family hydrolase